MKDLKVFEVTGNWKTFRIPLTLKTLDYEYITMNNWLKNNCVGPWKLFEISHGNKGNGWGPGIYGRLLQVDLLEETDIVAFKLKWL